MMVMQVSDVDEMMKNWFLVLDTGTGCRIQETQDD